MQSRPISSDGATLQNKGAFIYGGSASLETEIYLSDALALTASVKERFVWGNSTGHFHTQFGIGRGGDIFNLAGEFINSNEFVAQTKFISETLGGSFPTSFSNEWRREEKIVKAKDNPFKDIVEKPLSHPALRQYLRERGISLDVAGRYCCQLEYRYKGKRFFTVGFKNGSGGYEIRNRIFKGCVSPKDITLVSNGSRACHLYEGFMDFLSAVTLGIGRGENHLVLNSVANMSRVKDMLDGYDTIYCHLDNDEAGENACADLQGRYGERVIDHSHLYTGYKDLNEYLMSHKTRK